MDTDFTNGIYKICIWFMRLVYLNTLWVFFSLAGILLFGFFPATAAMFAVERKWIRGQEDIPVFHTFWSMFKQGFWKTNFLGFLLMFLGILLIVNYCILTAVGSLITDVIAFLVLFLVFIYIVVLFYVFPVYNHYKVKVSGCIKFAFFVGLSSPLMTVMIMLGVFINYFISMAIPGIIPVLAGSCLSFTTMWFAHCAFKRLELKTGNVDKRGKAYDY